MEEETQEVIPSNIGQIFLENWLSIVIVLAVLIVVIIIVKFISRKTRKVFEQRISDDRMEIKKRSYTVTSVFTNVIIVGSLVVALMIIATQLGINVTPLLAGAGVAGIVIGFGAQSLIKDLINGSFILFEQWFQVDDIVTVDGTSGVVEKFNLRTTVLRDLEGIAHYIPNGEIKVLSNRTHVWSRAMIEVGVHYKENTDRVIEVMEQVFDELLADDNFNQCILERPQILGKGGVDSLSDSAVVFKIICKVVPPNQWDISRQLRKRIKDKFDQVGIEIPYPCRNVYIRQENKQKVVD
ncbi:MAG: mechanosensitive ion channel family protein [Actinomycetia bacterium]|nr:mechanosensitive ion channel family protein [Actinomycetes bacterium]